MPIPDDARALPGKDVFRTWQRLQAWADSLEVSAGSRDIRLDKDKFGTVATAVRRIDVVWPFEVALSGSGVGAQITVEPGLMSALVPVVVQRDGSRLGLDGVDPDTGESFALPRLTVDAGPVATHETFVACRVRVDRLTGALRDDDPESLAIVHLPERPKRNADGSVSAGAPTPSVGFDAAIGYDLLALIIWHPDDTSIRRVVQAVHGNRTFAFKKGTGDRPDRFFFRLA